jgi:hypothetical protein
MPVPRKDDLHAAKAPQHLLPPAAALAPLLEAYHGAQALECDLWEFAIEIRCLREAGLSHTHLRWLLANKLIAQGVDRSKPSQGLRTFVPVANLSLAEATCFVLTEAGAVYALNGAAAPPGTVPRPCWDAVQRQLLVGPIVVKKFRQRAANQEKILEVFEEEGWPPLIDDPLSPQQEQDSKRRLHITINNLNRCHQRHLLHFHGGGDGQTVAWRLLAGQTRASVGRG